MKIPMQWINEYAKIPMDPETYMNRMIMCGDGVEGYENLGAEVENVVVEYRDRPEGSESKLNTYSDGFRVIRKMLQLYKNYKPMHFFGMLALLLTVISVILFVPVLLEYLSTGLVPRFPTLIACGFILLAGIQSFFSGMMLEVMAAKDRKDFEYRLNRVHGEHQERKGL